jgi:hypothetical protein
MKSLIPDWLPKLFVKAEGSVREATTKKFSDFNKITDTEGMEVVGIKGGANVRADFPVAGEAGEVTTSMVGLEPDDPLRNARGQFMPTRELPELENQKDANRFIASEIQRLDQEIDGIEAGGGDVDLSDYATIDYVDETELNVLNAAIKVATDGDKVLQEQIDELEAPDLTGYATEDYVDESIANIEFPEGVDLTGYATEDWVTGQIDAIPETDLSGYATEDYVDGAVSGVESIIPDIEGLASEDYVDEAIGGIVHPEYDDSGIKKDLADETAARIAGDNTLQTEITELALALDTLLVRKTHGQWKYVGFMGDVMARNPGEFALGSDDLSASNNIIQLNNTDLNGLTVGVGDISVGDYVELVDINNPENFVLFVVAGEANGQGISEIPVTLKEKGNNFLVNATCEIRFFELNDQSIDLSELDDRYARKDHTHPEFGELQGDIDEINEFLETLEVPDFGGEPEEGETDYRRAIGRFYCVGVDKNPSSHHFYLYNDGTGDLTKGTHFDINRGGYLVDEATTEFTEWDELLEEGEWLNFFIQGEHAFSGSDQYIDIQVGKFIEKIDGANGYDAFRFEVMAIRGTPAYATLDSNNVINSVYKKCAMNYGLQPSAFATTDQLNAAIDGVLVVSQADDAKLQSQIDFMKQELQTVVPIKKAGRFRLYSTYTQKYDVKPTQGGTSAVWGDFAELKRVYFNSDPVDLDGENFSDLVNSADLVGTKFEMFVDKDNWGVYKFKRMSQQSSYTYWDVTLVNASGSYSMYDETVFDFFDEKALAQRTFIEEMAGHYKYQLAKIGQGINVDNLHENPGRYLVVDANGNLQDGWAQDTKGIYFAPEDMDGNKPPVTSQKSTSAPKLPFWELHTRFISESSGVESIRPDHAMHPRSWEKPFLYGALYNQSAVIIPYIKIDPNENWHYLYQYDRARDNPTYFRWPV